MVCLGVIRGIFWRLVIVSVLSGVVVEAESIVGDDADCKSEGDGALELKVLEHYVTDSLLLNLLKVLYLHRFIR